MAAEEDVIKQFLVSLGFKIDESGMRKFTNALGVGTGGITTVALGAGKAVAGVALAAEAMVTAFALSMEKLYYASRRTGASVENIQALESGSRRIGLAAGVAQQSLEGMAAAVRMNPGLRGLMDSIVGHKTEGMDQTKAMIELVEKLASLPHYAGARFAQMFGMDEKTFFMMKDALPEMNRAMQARSDLNKRMGIDAQAAAEASKEYANSIRDIGDRFEVLGQKLSIGLLPYFRQFNGLVQEAIDRMTALTAQDFDLSSQSKEVDGLAESFKGLVKVMGEAAHSDTANTIFSSIKTGADMASKAVMNTVSGMFLLASGDWKKGIGKLFGGVGGAVSKSDDPYASLHVAGDIDSWLRTYLPGGVNSDNPISHIDRRGDPMGKRAVANDTPTPATPAKVSALFGRLETQYGLPDGFMDRVWNRESGRGNPKLMLSPAGAKGHFGFMDATAKQYGLKDPNNLEQSATASARYFHDLLVRYHGDLAQAAAAYNWGPTNLDKKGASRAPFETRQYVAATTGAPLGRGEGTTVTLHQKTDIHVNGGNSPAATGAAIGREQNRVNSDIIRNMWSVTQ